MAQSLQNIYFFCIVAKEKWRTNMHKDATPKHLTELAEWASRNIPPSYQWWKQFGTVACDGTQKDGYDLQSGPTYEIVIGKSRYHLIYPERKIHNVAVDLLTRHFKLFEIASTVAYKTRHGINDRAWVIEYAITTFDDFGRREHTFNGTASANDHIAAHASSLAIALCRALAHVAEGKVQKTQSSVAV